MQIDIANLLNGDRRTLGKAITLIESHLEADIIESQNILKQILPKTGKSFRVGITGVPGVGKSTFIETFGLYLISKGHKVAVLAIDPSSPISGGSILGDKTRMEKLSQDYNSFIRPSPASGFLGGVAQKTRETILLCEAAGYNYILVETVGVGQSEFEVSDMVDFFMVLMLPNAGDELQGIKKGILELADSVIINKADGDQKGLATLAEAQYKNSLELFMNSGHWNTRVLSCSSLHNYNIDTIYNMLCEFKDLAIKHKTFEENRLNQNKHWFKKLVLELIEQKITSNSKLKNVREQFENDIRQNKLLPLQAANDFIEMVFKK